MLSSQGDAGTVHGSPFQAGQHAGERAREVRDRVGEHGQAEGGEAGRVAVGVEHQSADLRPRALDDVAQDRPPAQRAQALVAAAHAPRQAAGQQQAR